MEPAGRWLSSREARVFEILQRDYMRLAALNRNLMIEKERLERDNVDWRRTYESLRTLCVRILGRWEHSMREGNALRWQVRSLQEEVNFWQAQLRRVFRAFFELLLYPQRAY